jgi:hypothetical protein
LLTAIKVSAPKLSTFFGKKDKSVTSQKTLIPLYVKPNSFFGEPSDNKIDFFGTQNS